MKNSVLIAVSLGLALGSLSAQTVPLLINYQGRVTDDGGIPLGTAGTAPNFSAAPENRKIIFRIFDAQTGGTRLWSEQQTVTISLGEFSVLLGQGIDAVYDAVTEARPALDTVFTAGGAVSPAGPIRYLEIVVDDGDGAFSTAKDAPITPRQRITTTAYSFRSKVADTVANQSVATPALADGAVTAAKVADNSITSLKILDGSVSTAKLPDNAITSSKIADGTVGTSDLANTSITAAKLDPAIGVWTVNAGNVARLSGSVGIGKFPAVALDVVGAITASEAITTAGPLTAGSLTTSGPFTASTVTANSGILVPGNAVLTLGVGIPGREGNAGKIGYQTFSTSLDIVGAGTTGANRKIKMWAEGGTEFNGRVGIGTASPAVPLDVMTQNDLTMTDNGYESSLGGDVGNNTWRAGGGYFFNIPRTIEIYGMSGGAHLGGFRNAVAPVSIRSDGWIASAKGLMVYSDRRIKRDVRESATSRDLAAIEKLKVTDYRMVDPSGDGMVWRKGFIAQEVEAVIPGAVTRSVEFVPDIFATATALQWHAGANTLSLTLGKDHDLMTGDRVRLHADGRRLDLDVLAAPSARTFVVGNCDRPPDTVLVYGKRVNDFRTVDYDRIFTTAVGALQELKKEKDSEVRRVEEENAALKKQLNGQERRLAALEAREREREAQLAEIEKRLRSGDVADSATSAVSLNPTEASR